MLTANWFQSSAQVLGTWVIIALMGAAIYFSLWFVFTKALPSLRTRPRAKVVNINDYRNLRLRRRQRLS
jgi:hypothetical protein